MAHGLKPNEWTKSRISRLISLYNQDEPVTVIVKSVGINHREVQKKISDLITTGELKPHDPKAKTKVPPKDIPEQVRNFIHTLSLKRHPAEFIVDKLIQAGFTHFTLEEVRGCICGFKRTLNQNVKESSLPTFPWDKDDDQTPNI